MTEMDDRPRLSGEAPSVRRGAVCYGAPRMRLVWVLVLSLAALVAGCRSVPKLAWPGEVRAAAERGPRIRPPEAWAPRESAAAFHARGWDTLRESWITDEALGPIGHCWTGTVRPIGDEGDVVASDLHEHGLEDARLGETTTVGRVEVRADDRSLTVCEPRVDVAGAIGDLAGECAPFGEAIAVLEDAIARPPRGATLTMDALRLRLDVHWRAPSMPMDLTIRRLAGLGFTGELAGEVGDPPRMRRTDDAWEVTIELPADGEDAVTLRASTELPRRPMCGVERPPPARMNPP